MSRQRKGTAPQRAPFGKLRAGYGPPEPATASVSWRDESKDTRAVNSYGLRAL